MLDLITLPRLLALSLIFFAAGALASLLFAAEPAFCRRLSHGFALCGAVVVLFLSLFGLGGGSFAIVLPPVLPLGGSLLLGLDGISAFFTLVIAVGAIPATFYAIGYTRHYAGKHVSLGLALNIFIPSMVLVVLARNVLTFLFFWEAMSLASYFLVMTESDREDTRSAGWLYMVMTHAGMACLLIGFLALSTETGSASMADWGRLIETVDLGKRGAIFVVMAAGFLSKAGAIPFHVWLPRAHPAAPSHISALMSGVMIKLGIYGLIRLGFDWLGAGPAWWGALILLAGAISALLGVLYAIVDTDLKRLLAYSSVENIGIIMLGVGAGLLFRSYALPAVASLALVAALYHTLNHAAFKGLLFLAAGSVTHATGTRNIEAMGGLLRRMPKTGALFLVGSLAISSMPPFNGFVSEWLTFQSLLLSLRIPEQLYNLIFALCIAALALTAGLAAACFVRVFGITFLALPRSDAGNHAHDGSWTMTMPMAALAIGCVILGIAPALVLTPLRTAVLQFTGAVPEVAFDLNAIAVSQTFGAIAPLWVAVILVLVVVGLLVALRLYGTNFARRRYETWGCGRAVQSARFEYTGSAFANPFKRVFDFFYRSVQEKQVEAHPESRFFVKTITYRHESRSIIEDSIYAPIGRLVRRISLKARALQSGNVHDYLLYILVALVALLLLAR